jgi:outer membrane receptor protein involved in Fe transport
MIKTVSGFAGPARFALLAGVATLAFPAIAQAQDTDAQQAQAQSNSDADNYSDATDSSTGNEIIVTATKREQTLQDVPVAVSVTTAETIERAQIRDVTDLATVVPSLRVTQSQSQFATTYSIRGFGTSGNNLGLEPSVAVFVDGVYRSRAIAQISDLPDIQRVEVLRGPQSTLFGKNASAGVISIVSKLPSFDFGGSIEASYGNYNAVVLKGMVTGPLSENIAASIAAGYNRRDGYNRDLATGNRTNDRNRWFTRGQLLFKGDSGLSIRLIADYGKIDENCCGVVNVLTGPQTQVLTSPLIGGQVNTQNQRFDNIVYNSFDSTNKIENYGFSGQIDYEVGPFKLTSITAWRKVNAETNQDSDFTSAPLLDRNYQNLGIRTFTQEFRASATILDKVTALLGVYYFNEKIDQRNELTWGPSARAYANYLVQAGSGCALGLYTGPCLVAGLPGVPPVPQPLDATFGALEGNAGKYLAPNATFFGAGQGQFQTYGLNNEAFSIFGQLDIEIVDRLTLTGGVNYTHDKKNYSVAANVTDVFSQVDFNNPAYATFRRALLFNGGVAQQVGTALGLGRSATQAEIMTFAGGNPAAFGNITTAVGAFADANQNNPSANPLNRLLPLQYMPQILGVPNSLEDGKLSDDNVSYTARLAFDASDHLNVYAGVATGYKAASINLSRDSRPTAADLQLINAVNSPYASLRRPNLMAGGRYARPEKSTVYELGVKGNWPIGAFTLAVFKQSIRDFQSNIFTGGGFFLGNAEKQSTWGVEFEGTIKPAKGLSLGVAVTYLNPKYDLFTNSAFGVATGVRPADIPEWSGTVSAQYDHEFTNGNHLILRGDFHFESEVQVVEGLPAFIAKDPVSGVVLPGGYGVGLAAAAPFTRQVDEVSASITYAMQNGFELTAWGRNLTDDRYINTIFDSPAQIGSVSAYTNQPRTYGVSARFRW